jgi:hypothetical protein
MKFTASNRTLILFAMSLCTVAFVTWSWYRLGLQQTRARDAAERLARCQSVAREIKLWRTSGHNELRAAPPEFQYGNALRTAASEAKIPEASFPAPALGPEIRIKETKYYRQSIASNLGVVSLPQCIAFLYHLASGEPPFQIESIQLNAANRGNQNDPAELWNPQINMTYLTVPSGNGR